MNLKLKFHEACSLLAKKSLKEITLAIIDQNYQHELFVEIHNDTMNKFASGRSDSAIVYAGEPRHAPHHHQRTRTVSDTFTT